MNLANAPIVSSWGWYSSPRKVAKWLKRTKSVGGRVRIRLMVNGAAVRRKGFYLNKCGRNWERIAWQALRAGVGVDLCSWLTRSKRFLDEAAATLLPMMAKLWKMEAHAIEQGWLQDHGRIAILDWDVEGPAVKDAGPDTLGPKPAAEYWARLFAPVMPHTSISCINAAAWRNNSTGRVVQEFIAYAKRVEMQCYYKGPTARRMIGRFRKVFGALMVVSAALRAYYGTTGWNTRLMREQYVQAEEAGVEEAVYWKAASMGTGRWRKFVKWVRPRRDAAMAAGAVA